MTCSLRTWTVDVQLATSRCLLEPHCRNKKQFYSKSMTNYEEAGGTQPTLLKLRKQHDEICDSCCDVWD